MLSIILQSYLSYSYLWAEDREAQIEAFCDKNPLIVEIGEKFQEYDQRAEDIRDLPYVHNIGAVQINMGKTQTCFIFHKTFLFSLYICFCR